MVLVCYISLLYFHYLTGLEFSHGKFTSALLIFVGIQHLTQSASLY